MGSMKIRSIKTPQVSEDFFPIELADFSGGLVDDFIAIDTKNLFKVFKDVDFDKGADVKSISKRWGFYPLTTDGWPGGVVTGFTFSDFISGSANQRFKAVIVVNGSMQAANITGIGTWSFSNIGTIGTAGRWILTTALLGTNSYLVGCNTSYDYIVHWDGTTLGTIATGFGFLAITFAYGRVFLSGAPTAPTEIFYSDYLDPLTYDFTSAGDQYKVSSELGGYIRALVKHPSQITIIKDTAIERFVGETPDTFSNKSWIPFIGTNLQSTIATYGETTAFLNSNSVRLLQNTADSISLNMSKTLSAGAVNTEGNRASLTEEDYYLYLKDTNKMYLYNLLRKNWREYSIPGTTSTLYEIAYSDRLDTQKPVFAMSVNGVTNLFYLKAPSSNLSYDTYGGGTYGMPFSVQWSDNIGGGVKAVWKKFNWIRVVSDSGEMRLSFAVNSNELTTPASNKILDSTPARISDYDYVKALTRAFNGKVFTIKLYTPTTSNKSFSLSSVTIEGQQKGVQYKAGS